MEETLLLNDGRALAHAEYGEPCGAPVFFFHGMPGSRLFRPPDEITRRLGVRLITIDRPGYGGSDYQPNRKILDWADDMAALADALHLDRFAVAGHSGGGPYVSACALALPGRVTVGAIVSGAGPVETPGASRGMSAINQFGLNLGRFIPWPLWQLLIRFIYNRRRDDPAAAMDRATGHRPPADEALIRQPEVRETCYRSEVEAFRNGLRGLAWDARLLVRPWGFPLEEIRVPVSLWHGTDDRETPLPMGEYVAGKIPNCRRVIFPGEGHLLLFTHWEEILTTIISS